MEYLTINRGATLKELGEDCYLLYDSLTKQHFVGNKQFAELLRLSDGTKTLEEVIQQVSNSENLSSEEIAPLVQRNLFPLIDEGIITKTTHHSYHPPRIVKQLSSYPLNTVYWEVTELCNFSCFHCYNSSSPKKSNPSLEPAAVLEQLVDAGVINVLLTGGEPFVRKDILSILQSIKARGMDFGVFSNGSLINSEYVFALKELQPKFIAVSFDSYNKETFEKIRGPYYSTVLKNIKDLLLQEIPLRINIVLFKGLNDSYSHIKDNLQFFKDMGVKEGSVSIDEFLPAGRGKKNIFQVAPRAAMEHINLAHQEVFGSPFVIISDQDDLALDSYCGIGTSVCYLKSNGKVGLCPLLSNLPASKHILDEPLIEIWKTSEIFIPFREKSHLTNESCSSCTWLNQCAGGCRAKAQVFNNDSNSPDEWMCAYFGKK